jgi:hypothetical protein
MSKITAEFRSSALRRGLLVESTRGGSSESVAFAGAIELANLGFVVSPADLRAVSESAIEETIKQARKIMGADRDMTPIYPGFPKQVQELSTMTLLVEQILHYWSAGALLPDYPSVVRDGLPIADMLRNARALRVVRAAEAARELTNELVSSPVALSVDDKNLLTAAMHLHKPSLEDVVATVKASRNGENIQSFITAVAQVSTISRADIALAVVPAVANSDVLLRVLLTLFTSVAPVNQEKVLNTASASANDRLRLEYVYGDVHSPIRSVRRVDADKFALATLSAAETKRVENYALAVNTLADRHSRAVYMLNVPRPVRRAVVEKLGQISAGYKADTVVGRRNLWRKLMTAVHAYDFNLTTAEKRIADIIHSNIEYRTLNSLIEDAMQSRDVVAAVELMAEYQPGNLLRRVVALLRLVETPKDAKFLADAVSKFGASANLTTLVSAYNGVIAANDDSARVTRVAGLNNKMVERADVVKVDEKHIRLVCKALKKAIKQNLVQKAAPVGPVPVKSSMPVPLVRRDAATADRQMDRGSEFAVAGEGDTLRIFSHWNNNQRESGYMDIGLVILDDKFKTLGVLTWNSWAQHRDLGTYSGDKCVYPGDSAAEYFDLNLSKVRAKFPKAIYAAMTIQSWSGWPTSKVDIIAGAMLRSKPDSGEVFDARSVNTAFKPTTDSTQSVPFAIDLRTSKMVWVDSSNGSTDAHVSSTGDNSIGAIVYDELERPRLTLGELATLWAKAHGAETIDEPVDQKELLKLL